MYTHAKVRKNLFDLVTIIFCTYLLISVFVLKSLSPLIFPQYYIFIIVAVLIFIFLRKFDFEYFSSFSWILYVLANILLLLTLIIGSVTRGTVRWIPIGTFAFQPSEVMRPFLFLFFAKLIYEIGTFDIKKTLILAGAAIIPLFLIFIQPSFGVTLITFAGFLGMSLSQGVNKKVLLALTLGAVTFAGLLFMVLKPYQKERIMTYLDPSLDPKGAGYNSIQSVIASGSGGILGKGLGQGVQTQLRFLPEKQTDFVFAALAEELGFIGSAFLIFLTYFLLSLLLKESEESKDKIKSIYIIGVLFSYFAQVIVHTGMNLGVLPITGVPFPLVSAGGSSLIGTTIMLAIAFSG